MELLQMKYFLAVAREESISRAADFLYITQPSLTRQIQSMEKEVGRPLFVRGKKMALTQAGLLLRKRAEEILSLYEKAESDWLYPDDHVGGDVCIGGGETYAMGILLDAAADMRARYPDIHIHIFSGDIADVSERLDKGLIDFGLLIEPADLTKYESLCLPVTDTWGLLMHKDHPLAARQFITPEDLKGIPLIQSKHSLPKSYVTEWYRSVDDIEIVATYNLLYNATLMAKAKIGCVLSLDKLLNVMGDGDVCFRPLSPKLEAHVHVAWKKYQVFSKPAQIFLKYVQEKIAVFGQED